VSRRVQGWEKDKAIISLFEILRDFSDIDALARFAETAPRIDPKVKARILSIRNAYGRAAVKFVGGLPPEFFRKERQATKQNARKKRAG
jgi:putative SOS response-associated peptidase YedK